MSCCKLFLICSVFCIASTWAINASPFFIKSTQPDGSVVSIRKVGNEHFNYTVTEEDSVLVVRDSSGYWNYADEHGKKTGVRVHAKHKREKKEQNFLKNRNSRQILKQYCENSIRKIQEQQTVLTSDSVMQQSSTPMKVFGWNSLTNNESSQVTNWPTRPYQNDIRKKGDVRGLVILVQFSDVKFKRDNVVEEYLDYLNKEGYSDYNMSGSIRDYFIENSMGEYRPVFDVAGPITIKGSRDSYGSQVDISKALKAVNEAVDQLVAENFDFTPYDSDGDRVVDFIYMIYAGVGSADTDVSSAIWPHSSSLYKRLSRNMFMNLYACSPELDGRSYMNNKNTTALNGIGTFCHEFCHVLGLFDIYDVNQGSSLVKRYTPGSWDLMDAGSYNCPQNRFFTTSCSPANLSAFERFSLGWLEPRRLEISDTTFILKSIHENDGLVLTSNKDNEYYFVDFRLKQGFDKGLPNQGMLIWHINYDYIMWLNNKINASDPMHVDLIEADGKADSYSVAGDAFPTSRVNSFNGFVTQNGDSLGIEVYDIKLENDYVTFKTRGKRISPVAESSSSINSSFSVMSSSSVKYSSSSEQYPSSSNIESSSSEINLAYLEESSSSEKKMGLLDQMNLTKSVRFSVADGVLKVNADVDGYKTVNLFDVNGSLLMTKSFTEKICEIHMNSLRKKTFIIATLSVSEKLLKVKKIQLK